MYFPVSSNNVPGSSSVVPSAEDDVPPSSSQNPATPQQPTFNELIEQQIEEQKQQLEKDR